MTQRKNLKHIRTAGWTTDGKRVVTGLFPSVSSEGLSIEDLVMCLHDLNVVMDWADFLCEARKNGWNMGALFTRIVTSIQDVYGPVYADGFERGLRALYNAMRIST